MVTSSYNALHQHLKLATAAAHSSFECVLAKRGYFDGREQYGGAWLLKQLAPLGITAAHGGSYLASYGSDRGKMWQRFLFTLEEAHLRGASGVGCDGRHRNFRGGPLLPDRSGTRWRRERRTRLLDGGLNGAYPFRVEVRRVLRPFGDLGDHRADASGIVYDRSDDQRRIPRAASTFESHSSCALAASGDSSQRLKPPTVTEAEAPAALAVTLGAIRKLSPREPRR